MEQAVVVKYMADGTLDNSFGTNGIAQLSFGSAPSSLAYSLGLLPDGRMIIGGQAVNGSGSAFAAARLNANGTLDPTFGVNGTQTTSLAGGISIGLAMALQSDGKVVITGMNGNNDVALVRYTADGTLDFSFGAGGVVVTPLPTYDSGYGIAMQPDGKIVVVGAAIGGIGGDDILLLRYISGVNVGIAETGPLSNVKLYPDPAQDQINISFTEPLSRQAVMTLVNATGQAVQLSSLAVQRSIDGHECAIALNGMAAGPYWLRVQDGSTVRSVSFVKE
ncbi:MAG: T9SS type A sorting domain-containing protein, partial [Flavobacteriales bacterium]